MVFIDRPKVFFPSLDIHWKTIASGIEIKKPKIEIPDIKLDIYGPKIDVNIHGPKLGIASPDIHGQN